MDNKTNSITYNDAKRIIGELTEFMNICANNDVPMHIHTLAEWNEYLSNKE